MVKLAYSFLTITKNLLHPISTHMSKGPQLGVEIENFDVSALQSDEEAELNCKMVRGCGTTLSRPCSQWARASRALPGSPAISAPAGCHLPPHCSKRQDMQGSGFPAGLGVTQSQNRRPCGITTVHRMTQEHPLSQVVHWTPKPTLWWRTTLHGGAPGPAWSFCPNSDCCSQQRFLLTQCTGLSLFCGGPSETLPPAPLSYPQHPFSFPPLSHSGDRVGDRKRAQDGQRGHQVKRKWSCPCLSCGAGQRASCSWLGKATPQMPD